MVGIDGVAGVEAVGQGDRVPGDVVARRFAAPDLPDAAEGAAVVLPAGAEAADRGGGAGSGEEEEGCSSDHGGGRLKELPARQPGAGIVSDTHIWSDCNG